MLIDGRRLGHGGAAPARTAPDINQIPTQLIERVDVLTGGASAIYGSDAVAGVVNFIMKKDFEGVESTTSTTCTGTRTTSSGPGQTKLRDVIEAAAAQPILRSFPCRPTR